MDFWRTSINTLVANLNNAIEGSFITEGNIFLSGTGTALNVSNGALRGNGIFLFSMNAHALLGLANNAKLQNAFINVHTTSGVTGGANAVPLGNTITLSVSVVDSITNTRTDMPASANSVVWAMIKANGDAINASVISATVDETRGGLGKSTYSPGDILVGNTASGKLDRTTITAGAGIVTTTGNGSVTVSANLIQGSGVILTSSGNSGITISANGYQLGNTTQAGLIRLYDDSDSTATDAVVTANAVNAIAARIASTSGRANLVGRMIDRKVYTTANQAGRTGGLLEGTFYGWQKPANTNWVKVICVGGGGAGANAGNTAVTTDSFVGSHGGAGGIVTWSNAAITIPDTVTVFVGGGGWSGANSEAHRSGAESYFGDNYIEAPGGYGGKQSQYAEFSNSVQQVTVIATVTSPTASTERFWDVLLETSTDPGFPQWHQTSPNHTLNDIACYAFGGIGGSTPFGVGGQGGVIGGMTDNTEYCHGKDGVGYGAGGGGAIADWNCDVINIEPDSKGWVRGGNGAPGLVIVESYSNS
jgi:hypothetical protein